MGGGGVEKFSFRSRLLSSFPHYPRVIFHHVGAVKNYDDFDLPLNLSIIVKRRIPGIGENSLIPAGRSARQISRIFIALVQLYAIRNAYLAITYAPHAKRIFNEARIENFWNINARWNSWAVTRATESNKYANLRRSIFDGVEKIGGLIIRVNSMDNYEVVIRIEDEEIFERKINKYLY